MGSGDSAPPLPAGKFKSIKLNPHGKITTTTKLYAPDPPPPHFPLANKNIPPSPIPGIKVFFGFFLDPLMM